MTLKKYAKICGSQESASHKLGTTVNTLNRWINGRSKPRTKAILSVLSRAGIDPVEEWKK